MLPQQATTSSSRVDKKPMEDHEIARSMKVKVFNIPHKCSNREVMNRLEVRVDRTTGTIVLSRHIVSWLLGTLY
jgi:hypothetical protein